MSFPTQKKKKRGGEELKDRGRELARLIQGEVFSLNPLEKRGEGQGKRSRLSDQKKKRAVCEEEKRPAGNREKKQAPCAKKGRKKGEGWYEKKQKERERGLKKEPYIPLFL